ncbi:MAG: hypothetical protein WA769_10825 [Pseudolabrys sp.]
MPPAIWEGITPQRINDVAYWHKADIGGPERVLLDIHILLARPKTSGCRLPHQVAQFVWTIEEFAAPI